MTNATSCNLRLIDDDTCLIVRNSTLSALQHESNREMLKLHKWCCANRLQINSEKSEATIIPSQLSVPKTDLIITYNDSAINCMEASKYLGVKLHFKLNYKSPLYLGREQNGQIGQKIE